MPKPPAWDPQQLEQLNQSGYVAEILRTEAKNANERLVWARAAHASGQTPLMIRALRLLTQDASVMALGLRAILTAQLGEYRTVLTLPEPARPRTRQDRYGCLWWRFARALALIEAARHTEAILELGRALELAEGLQLNERAQTIRFHLAYAENQMGRGNPLRIIEELEAPMSAPRQAWHSGSNYAAALLQRGLYERVISSVEPSSYFRAIALALTGREVEMQGTGHFHQAALCWRQAWRGESVQRVTGLRGTLMNTYARLACAAHLSRTPQTARLLPRIIGHDAPAAPDQAVLWAAMSLQGLARGATLAAPLYVTEALTSNLKNLDDTQSVLNVLQHLTPEALLIASYAPGAHSELLYARYGLIQQARSTWATQVTEGYQFRVVANHPGRQPNLGVVLVGLDQLASVANDEGRRVLERHWQEAREQLLWELPQQDHEQLRTATRHCTLHMGERTLEA